MIEVLIFAALALFVLSRLYAALGRGGDDRPVERRAPGTPPPNERIAAELGQREQARARGETPVFTGPAAAGLQAIYEADKSFSDTTFLQGAQAAYRLIVGAFARGDRAVLRPLLDDDVYAAWTDAIANREANGEAAFDLLRIRSALIDSAELEDRTARIGVRYEAELGDGETTRSTREIWVYKRDVDADDPNWLLDEVDMAS